MTAVHQLLPVYSRGDAIGAAVTRTGEMLRQLGMKSRVYAELYDPQVRGSTRPASQLLADLCPGDAVMYHLSIGSPVARIFGQVPGKRLLVYHNITPPEYFADASPTVRYWLDRGREDLAQLAPRADLCIADSEFNESELLAAGARRTVVIAPPLDLQRLHPQPAIPVNPAELLFVGRLAPNKRHDDLLRILKAVRATVAGDARLVLVGGAHDTGAYVAALLDLARRLGVDDAVEITGPLSDAGLAHRYRRAAVFVCASDHEGFCIPLVEAMAFSVPIVAHRAGAVPATLGDAGVLLDNKDPLVWAEVIGRVVSDDRLRTCLITGGRRRIETFAPTLVREQLKDALGSAGVRGLGATV